MIVSARSALDVAVYTFSHFLLNTRNDCFNDFAKILLKSEDGKLCVLIEFFENEGNNSTSDYRLLCGITKGRALRDIVIHQSNVRFEYHEYEKNISY